MSRATLFAVLLSIAPRVVVAQPVSTLHIKVALTEVDGTVVPVPRHTLLISDNPTTAAPRTVTTGVDGTVDVKLKPGNYTVESDRPVSLHGKAFQWTQTLDVAAGRDTVLELTAKNAENAGATAVIGAASVETEPSLLLPRWQDSVVAVWTPTTRVSGFVVDAQGLIATNQKAIGTATSVEVQFGDAAKVAARLVAADSSRDVAVLWVNPGVLTTAKPIPLGCAQPKSSLGDQQEIFAIGIPFRQATDMTSGTVAELRLIRGNEGGPVFTADGTFVGLTSLGVKNDDERRGSSRVVTTADVCEVVASAEKKIAAASPPSASHLPIEPDWPLPLDAFKNAAMRRAGNLNPYQMATTTFDVAFITPIMTYGVQYQSEQMSRRTRTGKDSRTIELEPILVRPVMDFANWSEYIVDFPRCSWSASRPDGSKDCGQKSHEERPTAKASRCPQSRVPKRASRGCARTAATKKSRPSIRSRSSTGYPTRKRRTRVCTCSSRTPSARLAGRSNSRCSPTKIPNTLKSASSLPRSCSRSRRTSRCTEKVMLLQM